jgi:hypothetical protein
MLSLPMFVVVYCYEQQTVISPHLVALAALMIGALLFSGTLIVSICMFCTVQRSAGKGDVRRCYEGGDTHVSSLIRELAITVLTNTIIVVAFMVRVMCL